MIERNMIYDVFNQNSVQQQMQKYHSNQMSKTFDCAKKLDDFLKSTDEVAPEYQQIAFEQCCMVIANHMKKYNIM